jgi:hypothetical protein
MKNGLDLVIKEDTKSFSGIEMNYINVTNVDIIQFNPLAQFNPLDKRGNILITAVSKSGDSKQFICKGHCQMYKGNLYMEDVSILVEDSIELAEDFIDRNLCYPDDL